MGPSVSTKTNVDFGVVPDEFPTNSKKYQMPRIARTGRTYIAAVLYLNP